MPYSQWQYLDKGINQMTVINISKSALVEAALSLTQSGKSTGISSVLDLAGYDPTDKTLQMEAGKILAASGFAKVHTKYGKVWKVVTSSGLGAIQNKISECEAMLTTVQAKIDSLPPWDERIPEKQLLLKDISAKIKQLKQQEECYTGIPSEQWGDFRLALIKYHESDKKEMPTRRSVLR